MIKFKFLFDKDKETLWLNEMSKKGYALTKFFAGFYTFEKCAPGKYIYQIDLCDGFYSINDNYRSFMEEMDVEIIQPWGYWVFLRKEASKGDFELYTDVDSSIEHYTKILKMFKAVTILEIICFFCEIFATLVTNSIVFALFTFLIGMLAVALMKITFKTKKIINELKARKGIIMESEANLGNGNVSPLLLSGLFLNLAANGIHSMGYSTLHLVVQIAAIVLMLVGIYQMRGVFKG